MVKFFGKRSSEPIISSTKAIIPDKFSSAVPFEQLVVRPGCGPVPETPEHCDSRVSWGWIMCGKQGWMTSPFGIEWMTHVSRIGSTADRRARWEIYHPSPFRRQNNGPILCYAHRLAGAMLEMVTRGDRESERLGQMGNGLWPEQT